jgi:hypothetical protein
MSSGRPWSSGSRSASAGGWSGFRGVVPTATAGATQPERCVEPYYLQRTRFESIAERKLRRRWLTEDGNALITARDLREGSPAAPVRIETWQ